MTNAKAVLFTYTASGKTFTDAYEAPEYPDPQLMCERTRAAVGDDFPDAIFSIGMNEEARKIMSDRRMKEMGLTVKDKENGGN